MPLIFTPFFLGIIEQPCQTATTQGTHALQSLGVTGLNAATLMNKLSLRAIKSATKVILTPKKVLLT